MMIPKHLLQALFSLALLLTVVHSQDVTTFTYDTFSANPTDLTYQGGTHVPPGSNALRLTSTDSSGAPRSWRVGRVLYSRPVQFWQASPARQSTFETTISFHIQPNADGAADGLAFFIAPVNTTIPPYSGGGYLGLFPSGPADSLFAVEFDTHVNTPWDPSHRHIGIDVNSINSVETTPFDSATGLAVTARINYDANTKTITVFATSGSQTAALSYILDLKTILPEQVQVGISSATGESPGLGIHDINSWYFTSTLVRTDQTSYIRQAV